MADVLTYTTPARTSLMEQLRGSVALHGIALILHARDREAHGLPVDPLMSRPREEIQKFLEIGKVTLALLEDGAKASATEALAVALCEGVDEEYAPWHHQTPRTQTHYRALAKHAMCTLQQSFVDYIERR